ncbi:MAG: zinc ribbon domain-containing protein [Clostridium sp.]
MHENYKNCQSCGMPLNKDKKGGGSEKNGNKSSTYCSFCYEDGKFISPNISVDDMKGIVVSKMIEMKFPKFIAKIFAKNIHKLERWKKQ